MLWNSALLLGLAHLCLTKPLPGRWDDVVEKHAWTEIPRGWQFDSPAPADHTFDLRIALKQDRMDDLIIHLTEVSDPFHDRYGNYLTKEEAESLVAPHPDSVAAVEEWLEFHQLESSYSRHTAGGEWFIVRVSVAQAERMLGTKYNIYYHPASGDRVMRTISYSLPHHLHSHVDVVSPTTYFGTLRSMRVTSFLEPDSKHSDNVATSLMANGVVPPSCSNAITPACLRALYKTSTYVPKAANVNKLGVAGYLKEYASYADLETFLKKFRKDAANASFTTVLVNGGLNSQSDPGIEANLDIQYVMGLSYPTPAIYYSTGGSPPFIPDSSTESDTNEPYLDWATYILDQNTIPQVITTSYGDDEQTVPRDYATKVCKIFAMLGARGTSMFFSSGDFGVGAGDCHTNDGKNRTLFQPVFPASCPYVTAVGGTTGVNPETAATFSGGGFSHYFARPHYQNVTVSSYLSRLGKTNAGLFNPHGRAYPDVSAQALHFQVVVGGLIVAVAGTSASCPTVASVFALLNDFRLACNKTSLGFVNPLLYSFASTGFNDIVSGSNPGCSASGFTAGKGWDPVTGLGTPDFLKLRDLLG